MLKNEKVEKLNYLIFRKNENENRILNDEEFLIKRKRIKKESSFDKIFTFTERIEWRKKNKKLKRLIFVIFNYFI